MGRGGVAVCSEKGKERERHKVMKAAVNREVRAAKRPHRTGGGCEGGGSAQEVDNSPVVIVSRRKT